MPNYKALFRSLRHAVNICNARAARYSQMLDIYTWRLNDMEFTQASQRAACKSKELDLNLKLFLKDKVEKRKARIQEKQEIVAYHKSVIAEAENAAKFLQDAFTVIGEHTYDNFDLDKIIESIKYAIGFSELKIELYQKTKSNYNKVISNNGKLANEQTNDAMLVDTKTFQDLAKRQDEIKLKYMQDIENLNIAIDIILKYKKLKESRNKILNAEQNTAIIVR